MRTIIILTCLFILVLDNGAAEEETRYVCGKQRCPFDLVVAPMCAFRYVYKENVKSSLKPNKKMYKTFGRYCEMLEANDCGEGWTYKHLGECHKCA